MSQKRLLGEQRFRPFFLTQFLGAFNDNLFKSALLFYVTFQLSEPLAAQVAGQLAGSGSPNEDTNTLVNLAQALFIAPFFLFSALAGQLADSAEKSQLIRRIKLVEIFLMVLAAYGLWRGDMWWLLAVLFCMGTQSAFFGPVKYAILPQHLREEELVGGNGLVEMGTFLAILLGTILGAQLIGVRHGSLVVGGGLIVVALAGWWTARGIPSAPASAPGLKLNWNLFAETWRIVGSARENRAVFHSILGISWFWAIGAIFLTQMPNYAKEVLGGGQDLGTWLLTTFSVGICAGSLLCERMSGRLVEIGLVPFGAIGMALFGLDLVWASGPVTTHALWRVLLDLFGVSLFGGFFIVPLYALIQSRSEPSQRSRVIAANNILNALFVVIASMASGLLLARGLSIPQLFFVAILCHVAVALFVFTLVPEFLMRFIVWILIHTIYRLDIEAIESIPDEGPAVIACNHVSFVDALIITAACRRPIRFVMYFGIYQLPILNFVFRTSRAIPIGGRNEDPALMESAFDEVSNALQAGDLVGIFPEGRITDDGQLNEFRAGIERIVARDAVPVIPMALQGLWGSFFSMAHGKAMSRWGHLIRDLRAPIGLRLGTPIPAQDLDRHALQGVVGELRGARR